MALEPRPEHHPAQTTLLRDRKRVPAGHAVPPGRKIRINDQRARRYLGREDSVVGFMPPDPIMESSRTAGIDVLPVVEPALALRIAEDCISVDDEAVIRRVIGPVALTPQVHSPRKKIVDLIAGTLGTTGEMPSEDDMIISGSMAPAIPIEPGQELSVALSGLGQPGVWRDHEGKLSISGFGGNPS